MPHIVLKLMNKFKLLGIPTLLLQWLFSYLHGRFQRVVVEGQISSCVKVFSGVPQGSVLSHSLFLIYINDITKLYLTSGSKLSLYADDSSIQSCLFNNSDIHDFQNDIDFVHSWVTKNYLNFNYNKCKCMVISKKNRPLSNWMPKLGDKAIEEVADYKYLGVIVSSTLSWSNNIQHIVMRNRCIICMYYRQFSHFANPETLLYKTCEVWNPHQKKDTSSSKSAEVGIENVWWDIGYRA